MDWKRLITAGIGGGVVTVALHADMVLVSLLDAVSRKPIQPPVYGHRNR